MLSWLLFFIDRLVHLYYMLMRRRLHGAALEKTYQDLLLSGLGYTCIPQFLEIAEVRDVDIEPSSHFLEYE